MTHEIDTVTEKQQSAEVKHKPIRWNPKPLIIFANSFTRKQQHIYASLLLLNSE